MTNQTTNGPVAKIRHGRISAAIFRNDTDSGPQFSFVLDRTYTDNAGVLKSTGSFGRQDAMALQQCVTDAWRQMSELYREAYAERGDDTVDPV